jgi:chromosome segregation protein
MRRLLRITLEGFKTFAGRTDLELGPGLTAVVGPNGSGKSNLIDAIAWAVGSRSWKSLRGDGMEDVIFHGSEREAAAPAAKVTLGFQNEDRLLGIDFSEVTVSREIVRGGSGGRLVLNGVEARLRDVQAVLSGTGLAGGFSLLRQGMVDKLVLSSPEEIGRWIEESANISGYRSRKQQAMDRLRKVEAHAAEAGRKAAALRRELAQVRERAAKARTRRSLEERRERLGSILRSSERRQLLESLGTLEGESELLRRELAALAAARAGALEARRNLEAELQAIGAEPEETKSALGPGEAVEERVQGIRSAADQLGMIAGDLDREGREGWPAADQALGRVSGAIQEIRRPGSLDPAARCASRLAELGASNAEVERLSREHADRSAELAGRACDRVRLEERLSALGPSEEEVLAIPEGADPRLAREELAAAMRELSLLGPVDETAEHREQDLLKEQAELAPVLEDLSSTGRQLAAFIRQMEAHTSRIFEETLARVDARFRACCEILFQGGDARLEPRERSTEEIAEPPGVEVRVRLPRKPEVSLGLLSGGERSLAGLALILALAEGSGGQGRLLILDEVDAALDETNAVRLALLLRELQRDHQILCVTHNRLTMRQATRLVGVVSGASAGSSLVKVALEVAEGCAA